MTEAKMTCFIIEGEDAEPDTTLRETDTFMLVPFKFMEQAREQSRLEQKDTFIYFFENAWEVVNDKNLIQIEIDERCVIQIHNGNVISHKYFVTV